ncbi:MAG TPA: hypothetical protein VFQ53_36630 [Kofleriaceae bacterium]|nr:hypothetical protein [Kofleriaceae bacterium]
MTDTHATARALYQEYVARAAVLERHRRYATEVLKATAGAGQTPVEPLATMGKDGGPLLCDVCRKPMILEGGGYQGVYADAAWRRNPKRGWRSWIAGGMVVRIESNGTLRVYHGYPGRSGCVLKADALDERQRDEFRARSAELNVSAKLDLLSAYFKAELPDKDSDAVLSDIYRVMFVYDPGLGINAPE